MTASRLDTSDGAHQGDADPSGRRDDWDSVDWDNVPFVCVHVSRPGPGWRGAFGRVPWIRAAVIAAAGIGAARIAALRFLPVRRSLARRLERRRSSQLSQVCEVVS